MTGWVQPPQQEPLAIKGPRMVRMRTAGIVGVVALLLGVGIGAAGSKPTGSGPTASELAAGPTLAPTVQPTSQPTEVPTPAATPTPSPAPTATPVPTPIAPVAVTGTGSQNTPPFDLPSGDFTVTVTGSADSNVIIHLYARGDSTYEPLFNEIANGSYSYSTVIYGVTGGSYYLDVIDHGAWTVTFTPLP